MECVNADTRYSNQQTFQVEQNLTCLSDRIVISQFVFRFSLLVSDIIPFVVKNEFMIYTCRYTEHLVSFIDIQQVYEIINREDSTSRMFSIIRPTNILQKLHN